MTHKFNDFTIHTQIIMIETNEEIIAPVDLDKYSNKPVMGWKKKTREITTFAGLGYKHSSDNKYYRVISDIFVFIDLIEIMRAFNGNKLNTDKEYQIEDSFTAKTAQKDGDMYLKIHFANYSNSLYLDKFECSSLAAKFNKIIQRCEPWQELEA